MTLEFSRQIFEKILKFHEIRPVGAELFHTGRERRTDGQTDRHDEANSSFSQFCESVN